MNGKRIALIVSVLAIVGAAFGAYFAIEAKFCPQYRIAAAEEKIQQNTNEILAANKRIDQQTIKDYRRQIREIEYEYGTRDRMPEQIRKYYDWLKDELNRLIAEQKGSG